MRLLHHTLAVTDAYLQATYTKREEIIGKGLFEVFPDNPELATQQVYKTLVVRFITVLEHKTEHRMEDQRYDVSEPIDGRFQFKVWRPLNKPVAECKWSGAIHYPHR